MLALTFGFALGILVSHGVAVGLALSLTATALCAAAGLLALKSGRQRAAAWLVLAGFIFAGTAAARLFQHRFPANHISHLTEWDLDLAKPVEVEGRLRTPPLPMPYGIEFDLEVSHISNGRVSRAASGKIRLRILNGWKSSVPAGALHLRYGESIRALALLGRPHNYQNPGSFNYRRWLETIHDITWEGTVETPAQVEKIKGPPPALLSRAVDGARERLQRSIDELFPPWSAKGRDGAVLRAVLLGDRSALDSATVENFRQSGLYHLLVVAGLHVGLLALLVGGLLRLFRLQEPWRSALLLAFLAIYAVLVEQRAPTLRATLMIAAYIVARLLDREQPALNAVGIAGLILLFYRPAWLFDSGFELSFAAALLIAGLAVPVLERVTEPYRRALRRVGEVALDPSFEPRWAQFRLDVRSLAEWLEPRGTFFRPIPATELVAAPLRLGIWIADLVIFSAILQLGLLLPMAQMFHRVTLAGIGLNALAVPLMTLLLAVAVPVVLLNVFSPILAALPARALALIMAGLFHLTELPRLPGWLSFRVPAPPVWVAWGFALSIVAAAFALALSHHRQPLAVFAVAASIFGLLIALHPLPPRLPGGEFQVTALDCGGGEALFVVFPNRTTMLIGAGGGSRRRLGGGDPFRAQRWDPGENIVSPYLWSRGIDHLDVFFIPSLRGDYLSGVASILRNFPVKEFWYGTLPRPSFAASLMALLAERGVRSRRVTGDFRAASVPWPIAGGELSDSPVIARIASAEGSLLLAAGVNRSTGKTFVESGDPLTSEVVALSHDDVESVSEWIVKAHPRAIIEEGFVRGSDGDSRGEPTTAGVEVFNTVRDGAVTVDMKGNTLTVRHYRQP
ncbi:MAG: ComEC/Rec2 family competence protein [Terriglobia bacterium]